MFGLPPEQDRNTIRLLAPIAVSRTMHTHAVGGARRSAAVHPRRMIVGYNHIEACYYNAEVIGTPENHCTSELY